MKIFKPNKQVVTVFQLSLIPALYLAIQSGAAWYWWVLSFLFYDIVYGIIGHNLALHRYAAHGHFKLSKPLEAFFIWCGAMSLLGEPISYSMMHLVHHKYPDSPIDPHGPQRGWKSVLICFHKEIDYTETPVRSKHLINLSKRWRWLFNYYILFVAVNALILYMISWKVFLFLWWIPASSICTSVAIGVVMQHRYGKPNNGKYNGKDSWFRLICLGAYEELHENHHLYPRAPNTALTSYQVDTTYQFGRLFRLDYDMSNQPPHEVN